MPVDRQRTVLPVVVDPGSCLLEVRHELPAALESASVARRYVREALHAVDRDALSDVAELVVSEVVTNATLHAHTHVELWLAVAADGAVFGEVRDFNPAMPVLRDYDVEATTGRGMGLVLRMSSACGVHSLGEDGKVVWFRLANEPGAHEADDLLSAWDIDDLLEGSTADVECRDVQLLSMPATLWLSARQHHDAMMRELVLYQAAREGHDLDLTTADAARSIISNAVIAAVEHAQATGVAEPALPEGHPSPLPWVPKQLDLRVTVPADAAATFATLQDVLDTAERLAAHGDLLARPALPEIVAVRDWACEQVIAQLAGNAPSPWPGTDQERFERAIHDDPLASPAWDTRIVTEATTGVIAADDANRIVAISDPLASLLGWEPEELVGRRVVTVIPPALREAHVAGFSRHLSTGEAHVLGVPLDLPVLCRDGREVRCRFMVERGAVSNARTLYLAWIDPLDEAACGDETDAVARVQDARHGA